MGELRYRKNLDVDIEIIRTGNSNSVGRFEVVVLTGDKVNLLTGKVKLLTDGSGDSFVPSLDVFGVVDPGTGKETKAEVDGGGMGFVVFELIGNKEIDKVVDIGDGGDKNGQSAGFWVKITNTAAGGSGNGGPGGDIFETSGFENTGILTQDD